MTKHQHGSIMWAILALMNLINFNFPTNNTLKIIHAISGSVCGVISLYHWIAMDLEEK